MTVTKITSSNTMITSSDIQVKYEQLYQFLMDFLWEFQVVQAIANLELAIFKRFPDKNEMLSTLSELKRSISETYNELDQDDESEFKEAFEDLETAINEFDDEKAGCELYGVEVVIDDPDDVVDADSDINSPETDVEKRKFRIGDIQKTTKEERELQEEAARTLENPFEQGAE